jgi:Tfp pilus assembly PilM family ATPase
MLFKKSNAVFAVELGPDLIRAVQLTAGKGKPGLSFFASQSVAPGLPDSLPDRQLAALGELLKTQRIGTREILATVPTNLVVTRTVQIDKQRKESQDEQIQMALQNCLSFDPKDLIFDHWPLNATQGNGRGGNEVLVVAIQGSVVRRYLEGFEKLGVTCVHMDVAPCALASLIPSTQQNAEGIIGSIALSRSVGFFAITERDRVLFWRPFDLSGGGSQRGVSVAGIQANLERVGDEISKCVSHMVGTMHLDNLNELLLFGHGSDDVVVSEYMSNRFHVPVRSPSPFAGLAAAEELINDKQATHYGTVTGLALQQIGAATHG